MGAGELKLPKATRDDREPNRILVNKLSCARNALDDNQLEGDPEKPCKLKASQSARFPSCNQGIARKREFDDPIPLPDGASLSGCATRVNSSSFSRLRA